MVDQERPSPYFGDYPHGAYWSAVAREGTRASDEEGDYTVGGLDQRGRELAERLQTEVGSEYRVWYHA